MGAKTAMVVFADRDPREILRAGLQADAETSRALAEELFPGRINEAIGTCELADATYPLDGTIYTGRFSGLDIICCREFMDLAPGCLDELIVRIGGDRRAYVHLMHSVSDALTFACWSDGQLLRRLSLAPDSGVTQDHGARLGFEWPYWAGDHPVTPDPSWWDEDDDVPAYPLPFHPLELGELVLKNFFGFTLEGWPDPLCIDPFEVQLMGFRVTPTKAGLDKAAAIASAAQRMTRRTILLPPAPRSE